MPQSDALFAGSIPEIYDTFLVPLIFEASAEEMAKRIAALSPETVLEIAAGTGVVTRAVTPKLSADARYFATDLNEPMLALAARRQGADPRISWRQADALALPFDDAMFDVVCCQFGAMFFADRPAAYREPRRVLKRRGCFLFNVWDGIEENAFANHVTQTLAEMFPDNPPRFMARTPHGYHDATLIRGQLEAAGFRDVAIEVRAGVSRAPSPRHVAIAYCQGTPLRSEIEARGGAEALNIATDRATQAIACRYGDGEVSAKIQELIVTATA